MERPEFADLFEEGVSQACRATSPERRAHIAKLLKNGITSQLEDLLRERRLLMLLGDLNDLEILTLQFYNAVEMGDEDTASRLQPQMIGPRAHLGGPLADVENEAIHNSHRERLLSLGLLQARYVGFPKGAIPHFDERTGKVQATGEGLSPLGRTLLESLDQQTIWTETKRRQVESDG